MRRLVFGLAVLAVLASRWPPCRPRAPLDDARRRGRPSGRARGWPPPSSRRLKAALARAEDQLAYDRAQLQAADRQRREARAALAGQAAAMYPLRRPGLADALLDRDPAAVPGRSRWPPCW